MRRGEAELDCVQVDRADRRRYICASIIVGYLYVQSPVFDRHIN